MLVGLAVLWLAYDAARQPAKWQWASAKDDPVVASVDDTPKAQQSQVIVPGPNDLDPKELSEFQSRVELITDRTALRPREMIAYWQLLKWSQTQSLAELEKRAKPEPALTQIWEQPQRYRAQPIRLKLHVRRVLDFDAPENPLKATRVYEAMGWTDQSKSLPYTVICLDKPENLPIGPEVEAEVIFTGYFLKIMTYTAFDDTRRGTPLLLGKLRVVGQPVLAKSVAAKPWELWAGGGVAAVMVIGLWRSFRTRRPKVGTQSKAAIAPNWVPFAAEGDEAPQDHAAAFNLLQPAGTLPPANPPQLTAQVSTPSAPE